MAKFETEKLLGSPLLLILCSACFAQYPDDWIKLPKEEWQTIALTNHVQYRNGDRYIDPSFK